MLGAFISVIELPRIPAYSLKNLTEEEEICLDQFGGSCNMVKAAVNTNRFAICYELAKEFVDKAVKRFNMRKLYEEENTTTSIFTFDTYGQMKLAI